MFTCVEVVVSDCNALDRLEISAAWWILGARRLRKRNVKVPKRLRFILATAARVRVSVLIRMGWVFVVLFVVQA